MLYSSLNNISLDTKLESTNSISDKVKLTINSLKIKLIKWEDNVFYIVNGDDEKTFSHSLHILKYNPTTNRLEHLHNVTMFEYSKDYEKQINHTFAWKQNGQHIYFFEKKGLEPVKNKS